jgi:hypothetical protein
MGTLVSFPITTTKIDELFIYGAIDNDAKKKDLYEVSKNEGTSASPVYNTGGSRKITGDELISVLGIAKQREVITVTVLDAPPMHGSDTITDVEITESQDNYYIKLEYISRIYTDHFFGAFNLVLPDEPRNGFSVQVSFDTNGVSTNDFDDFTFSSGFTYLITWSVSDEKWLYDKQDNIQDRRVAYIYNYQNNASLMKAHEAGQTYYIEWGTNGATSYFIELPLLRINIGQKIKFILNEDMEDHFDETERPINFKPQNDTVTSSDDVLIDANNGTYITPPPLCKKGSSWEFTAIYDVVANQEAATTFTTKKGWFCESKIIL